MRFCASCGVDFWKAAEAQAAVDQAAAPEATDATEAGGEPPRRRRRWVAWVGAAVAAFFVIGIVGSVFADQDESGVGSPSPTSSSAANQQAPGATDEGTVEPTPEPTEQPTAKPTPKPVSYKSIGDRSWRLLVKAPDDYSGKGFVVWACISQFDAATGEDSFLGQASNQNQDYWWGDGDNAMFTGDASDLNKFVEDDVVEMNVVSRGSFSYDTQIGGNTTVPLFEVDKIRRHGSCA